MVTDEPLVLTLNQILAVAAAANPSLLPALMCLRAGQYWSAEPISLTVYLPLPSLIPSEQTRRG